ncbi:MAG: two-component regulator propeller domain-containing protein [Dysgonomonas sp.]
MRNTFEIKWILILLFLFISLKSINAYNLEQFSSKDGLSNSAVICIYEDSNRIMWFGTYDGLNKFNGKSVCAYKPNGQANSLSGNIIYKILETEPGVLWINTTAGLNKIIKNTGEVKYYNKTRHNYLVKDSSNQLFKLGMKDSISVYNPTRDCFDQYYLEPYESYNIKRLAFDSNNILWFITNNGEIHRYKFTQDEKGKITEIKILPRLPYTDSIRDAYVEGDKLYIVGNGGNLSVVETSTGQIRFITNILSEMDKYGYSLSGVVSDGLNYFVAFTESGVIMKYYLDSKGKYKYEKISINCYIFSLYRDPIQNILWIATDGLGVFKYSEDEYSYRSTTFHSLYNKIQKPVRSVFYDKNKNLWIGSKGSGLLQCADYDMNNISPDNLKLYTTENSELTNNLIFSFSESQNDWFWIGSNYGLNYYSYKTNKIHRLKSETTGRIAFTHNIYEQNDTTLWLASSGEGLQKVTLKYQGGEPKVKKVKNFRFFQYNNNYFSIIPENDSILWIGSRHNGAVRFNTLDNTYKTISHTATEKQLMNDILCILKDSHNGIWFGTSLGLVKLISYESDSLFYKNYNELHGLPNNTVHGILEDNKGMLWLSTNNGIIKFDPLKETYQTLNHRNNTDVIEFSDNAYYEDESTSMLFFGGVNGFSTVSVEDNKKVKFNPDIYFYNLTIYGNEVNIGEYTVKEKNELYLELPYNKNFFSLSFIAIDYTNGVNYTYAYQLNGFDEQWVNNGLSNTVSFTNIQPGDYILNVRYNDKYSETDSQIYSCRIKILPPWYRSNLAYFLYSIILLVIIYIALRIAINWYKMKKNVIYARFEKEQKEEIYESKLRFFTNITHELCTPLTLISGPCEKILSYNKTDNYIHKYAHLIQRNVDKLNGLIQELIEFRRLETGHKSLEIIQVNISELTLSIIETFSYMSEVKNINYTIDIEKDIYWNTDNKSFSKIVTNLISNAFKYTPDNGEIKVNLTIENDNLTLSVSNTGKGIKPENITKIFDRYQILDDFERQSDSRSPIRNGLGLAICDSIVKLLKGNIEVSSILNEKTVFTVILPKLNSETEHTNLYNNSENTEIIQDESSEIIHPNNYTETYDMSKPTVLIVDDDKEILWFVSDVLSKQYNIISIKDSTKVLACLNSNKIDIIILDIMMPAIDGISLTKKIKADKKTSHIPLILLSAKNQSEDQITGLDAGAEMYITKPFNVQYLEKAVSRLLQRDEELKKYYQSAISSFDISDGRLVHKDDIMFSEKVTQSIADNLSNPDLSVELLSLYMGLSSRQFYRKLKKITKKTPADIIKEYRFKAVERLLVTTNMTIDEIIFKTGFNNRGNFYKTFLRQYGITPKKYREQHTLQFIE